jgi:outer membrane protein insertion porin family
VPGAPDQVDLTVNVTEKPTGSLQLGAGFSSAEKLALTFGIKQENVFGSGNYLGVEVNTSKYNRTLSLHHRSVLHAGRHLAHHRPVPPHLASLRRPGRQLPAGHQGAGMRFGVPFSESTRCSSASASSACEIEQPGTNIPAAYLAT